MNIGGFLSGPRNPEHQSLLRLIGSFIYGRDSPKYGDDHSHGNTGEVWSNAELRELGNIVVGGLSIEEIARVLGRNHGGVRDKDEIVPQSGI